jgi:acyl carrier protein
MNDADLIKLFQSAAQEVAGYNLENLSLDTKLSDLSLDSVAVMEIIGVVEQKLEIRFDDEDLSRLTTVRDLSALIKKAKGAAA